MKLKEINRLAIPSIISGLAEPIIGITDTALVSHTNDQDQLAAMGVATTFIATLVWVLSSFRNAAAARIASLIGLSKKQEIDLLISQLIILSLSIGIVAAGLTGFFTTEIFNWYGLETSIHQFSVKYYSIRIISFPFLMASYVLFGIFKGLQDTKTPMFITFFGVTINIILDYLLINGWWHWGIEGAAWASSISHVCMFIVSITIINRKSQLVYVTSFYNSNLRMVFKNSANLLVRTLSLNLVFIINTRLLADFEKTYQAIHTVLMQLWLFGAFFIDGYANAALALAGKIKAKGMKEVKSLGTQVVFINLFISFILVLILFSTQTLWQPLFNIEIATPHLLIMLGALLCGSLAFSFDGLFIGLEKISFLRNVMLLSTFFIFIPSTFLLIDLIDPLLAIWAGMIGWLMNRSLLPAITFYKIKS